MWVAAIVVRRRTPEELLQNLLTVLRAYWTGGLFAAAHKCNFFSRSVTWWGKVYSNEGMAHLPERIKGLVNTRRSATGEELMQLLQAVI